MVKLVSEQILLRQLFFFFLLGRCIFTILNYVAVGFFFNDNVYYLPTEALSIYQNYESLHVHIPKEPPALLWILKILTLHSFAYRHFSHPVKVLFTLIIIHLMSAILNL